MKHSPNTFPILALEMAELYNSIDPSRFYPSGYNPNDPFQETSELIEVHIEVQPS